MIAACIFVLAIGALVQWVIAYCRSFIVAADSVEISQKTLEVADLGEDCTPCDFDRILGLVRMAPNPLDDEGELRTVSTYFHIVSALSHFAALVSPSSKQRLDRELSRCTHFAAVALDRRLASIGVV